MQEKRRHNVLENRKVTKEGVQLKSSSDSKFGHKVWFHPCYFSIIKYNFP